MIGEEPAIVVKATYELSDREAGLVSKSYGAGVLTNKKITLSKGYANQLFVGLRVDEGCCRSEGCFPHTRFHTM